MKDTETTRVLRSFGFAITLVVLCLAFWPASAQAQAPVETALPPRPAPPAERLRPPGAFIQLQINGAPAGVWTGVQWMDSQGGWHDVTGWQGSLDNDGTKTWFVGENDMGKGPFRWCVYSHAGGDLLAASEAFHLPVEHNITQVVVVTLS